MPIHFCFETAPTSGTYTLSLHDALPILAFPFGSGKSDQRPSLPGGPSRRERKARPRSEEHTSELQSQFHLVCRLLLEKKKPGAELVRALDEQQHVVADAQLDVVDGIVDE